MTERARHIYEKYLGPMATEPVNVDSEAVKKVKEKMTSPSADLFEMASTQVRNSLT